MSYQLSHLYCVVLTQGLLCSRLALHSREPKRTLNLDFLPSARIAGLCHWTWLGAGCLFVFEVGSHYVFQAGLEHIFKGVSLSKKTLFLLRKKAQAIEPKIFVPDIEV